MANIYEGMTLLLSSFRDASFHLRKNYFNASKDMVMERGIRRIKAFLSLTDTEAAVFSAFFISYLKTNRKPVSCSIVAEEYECTPLAVIQFQNEIKFLEERGLIFSDTIDDSLSFAKFYRIPESVIDAIINEDKGAIETTFRARDKNLTYPDQIAEKELFYSDSVKAEVGKLYEYLDSGNFNGIQKRLAEKKLSEGVCIMLYGDSGTGKTETVLQLARKTNRCLLRVDIGSTISCWHGGTERNLSELFGRYERLCKRAKENGDEIPILLFNEADAIFGKRLNSPTQGSEISENHIQSVLLEYLEKQTGILIVTTNLAGNFDDAFERRFLFKIKYEKPDVEIKKKIWKYKAPWLNSRSIEKFAESYSFSGAEIDNIVRKATMKEVLTGSISSVEDLDSYCKSEKLNLESKKSIGFN